MYLSALLAFFVAPLDNYLYRWDYLPFRPTILFALGFLPIGLVAATRWWRAGMPLADPGNVRASNGLLIASYGFLTVVYLLWTILPEATPQGDGPDVLRLYGLVNLVAALACARAGLREDDLRMVLLPALLVLVGSMTLDAIEPGTFSVDGYRAAGIAENSNMAGFSVVLIAAAMIRYDRLRIGDLLCLGVATAAALATFSRAALLLALIVFAIWGIDLLRSSTNWPRTSRIALGVVGLSAATGLVVTLGYGIATGDVYRWVENDRVATLLATDGPESLLVSGDRERCARYSLDALPGAWWLGRGTGYTRSLPIGPHNLWLEQWVSNGVPGMLGLAAFLVVAAASASLRRSGAALAVVAILAAQCLFSHNLLDERAPLLVLGLVLGVTRRGA